MSQEFESVFNQHLFRIDLINSKKPIFANAASAVFTKVFGNALYVSRKPTTYILIVNPNGNYINLMGAISIWTIGITSHVHTMARWNHSKVEVTRHLVLSYKLIQHLPVGTKWPVYWGRVERLVKKFPTPTPVQAQHSPTKNVQSCFWGLK